MEAIYRNLLYSSKPGQKLGVVQFGSRDPFLLRAFGGKTLLVKEALDALENLI